MYSQSYLALDVFRFLWDIELLSAVAQVSKIQIPFDSQFAHCRDQRMFVRMTVLHEAEVFCGFGDEVMQRESQDYPWRQIDSTTAILDMSRLTAEFFIAASANPGFENSFRDENSFHPASHNILRSRLSQFLGAVLLARFALLASARVRLRDVQLLISTLNEFMGPAAPWSEKVCLRRLFAEWQANEFPLICSAEANEAFCRWVLPVLAEAST